MATDIDKEHQITHNKHGTCLRCRLARCKDKWALKLPVVPADLVCFINKATLSPERLAVLGKSWLQGKVDEKGVFGLGCMVCEQQQQQSLAPHGGGGGIDATRAYSNYAITNIATAQMCNFKRHSREACHSRNTRTFLNLPATSHVEQLRAPDAESFNKVLVAVRKGMSPTAGIKGVGGKQKIQCMCWTLAEAMREEDKAFMKKGLVSFGMARDESKNRLDIRFSGTVCVKGLIQNLRGFLGRARTEEGSTATDLLNVTRKIFKTFATAKYHPPAANGNGGELDGALQNMMTETLHHVAIDSASNELLTSRMMHKGEQLDNVRVFAPNLMDITRDKTHGSRRNPSRA